MSVMTNVVAVRTHGTVRIRAGLLAVRDAIPADVEAYVNYWHYSGERVKQLLGIDPQRLGTPQDSRERFLRMLPVPDGAPADTIFTITLNDAVIGYTNINWRGPDDSCVHLHTYRGCLRGALGAKDGTRVGSRSGVAAALFGLIGGYFELFPLRRVILQTRPTNTWINRALDLYMPPAETRFIGNPAGLAAPGDCHVRYVRREDIGWIRARAESLGNAAGVGAKRGRKSMDAGVEAPVPPPAH